jgi:dihydrofolate synthase/folylpolyglutamate synthase
VFLDAAHNPDGAAALAESLPEIASGRPVLACVAILRDKDADAMIDALAPALTRAVCAEIPTAALAARGLPEAASHSAVGLAAACEGAGLAAEAEADLDAAIGGARRLARESGGVLVVTGSHYLLSAARAALQLCEDS